MIRNWLFGLLLLTAMGRTSAQQQTTGNKDILAGFRSFTSLQVLHGSTTTSFALHTVNGFCYKRLFAGIGIAFDNYFHKSVPLFVEARFDLLKQRDRLQVFADGGINFPLSAQNLKYEYNIGKYKTGSVYGVGLDYLLPVMHRSMIFGVAFSNKQVIQMIDYYIWNPILNVSENNPRKDSYSLNHLALRIGLMF